MSAIPATAAPDRAGSPVLEAEGLTRIYRLRRGMLQERAALRAVDEVSFRLEAGRTLAVVGESGCGKSTLARMAALIEPPSAGRLRISGQEVGASGAAPPRALRRQVQIVFQDPYGSLNPRHRIETILEEPLVINTALDSAERAAAVRGMMSHVGLAPEHLARYPHMFSGGQRQRIAIARALMLRPKILVADEPLSALDVSIQAQVLNLLMALQEEFGLAYLFISHALSVVRHIADEVMVMYLGRSVEHGLKADIFASPRHPYTKALLASTPFVEHGLRARRMTLKGELPSPLNPPSGCAFHPRCPFATERCRLERPFLRRVENQRVACHHAERIG
jgi:dipeptide transport system ATP-binding protein